MNNNYRFEICIDSVQSAINAAEAGAHRVELCDNLFEGGTTPSAGMIRTVKNNAAIKVFVIIRPRGGDFLYSSHEADVMLEDIRIAKDLGADGIVSGALTKEGEIDLIITEKLIKQSGDLPFTFHRAFDMCKDPIKAMNQLIDLGASRILTSGLKQTAEEGLDNLQHLVEKASNRIIIMPGSGIKPNNIALIATKSKAQEFHFSGRKTFPSKMIYKNDTINMGGIEGVPEFSLFYSDKETIHKAIRNVTNI